jgi:hypothetical protein
MIVPTLYENATSVWLILYYFYNNFISMIKWNFFKTQFENDINVILILR